MFICTHVYTSLHTHHALHGQQNQNVRKYIMYTHVSNVYMYTYVYIYLMCICIQYTSLHTHHGLHGLQK